MNYVLVDGKVTVVEERTVAVGAYYRINSSNGMAGIITGDIKVIQIKLPEDMTTKERNWTVDSWDTYEPGEEGYEEYMDMITSKPWVEYEYVHAYEPICDSDKIAWLPLEEFLAHKSQH
jgi:hypothetical protein